MIESNLSSFALPPIFEYLLLSLGKSRTEIRKFLEDNINNPPCLSIRKESVSKNDSDFSESLLAVSFDVGDLVCEFTDRVCCVSRLFCSADRINEYFLCLEESLERVSSNSWIIIREDRSYMVSLLDMDTLSVKMGRVFPLYSLDIENLYFECKTVFKQ